MLPLQRPRVRAAIVFDETVPVSAVDEGQVQLLRVRKSVLHTGLDFMRIIFRFDDRERNIRLQIQNVICAR